MIAADEIAKRSDAEFKMRDEARIEVEETNKGVEGLAGGRWRTESNLEEAGLLPSGRRS